MKSDDNIITMIDRACKVLDFIHDAKEPIGVSGIAKDLVLPKANVFRILTTLEKNGFVERDPLTNKYQLGLLFIMYGERVKHRMNLKSITEPFMKKLTTIVGESINLGIVYDQDILVIHREEGESSALISKLIPISPLYCSAMGKLFLAHMSLEELESYFSNVTLEKRTINTIVSLEEFLKERDFILKNGISYDAEEYEYGLSCMAAPIYDCDQNIIASISVSGPTSRIKMKDREKIQELLKESSEDISKKIEIANVKMI